MDADWIPKRPKTNFERHINTLCLATPASYNTFLEDIVGGSGKIGQVCETSSKSAANAKEMPYECLLDPNTTSNDNRHINTLCLAKPSALALAFLWPYPSRRRVR